MVFELGHEDRSLYDMGFGALMITVDRPPRNTDGRGGEMDVSYSVAIENETAGHIDYHIHGPPAGGIKTGLFHNSRNRP